MDHLICPAVACNYELSVINGAVVNKLGSRTNYIEIIIYWKILKIQADLSSFFLINDQESTFSFFFKYSGFFEKLVCCPLVSPTVLLGTFLPVYYQFLFPNLKKEKKILFGNLKFFQFISVHIFRKKNFKDSLKKCMSESLNATSTPLTYHPIF